jgi:hypothetical protein
LPLFANGGEFVDVGVGRGVIAGAVCVDRLEENGPLVILWVIQGSCQFVFVCRILIADAAAWPNHYPRPGIRILQEDGGTQTKSWIYHPEFSAFRSHRVIAKITAIAWVVN